MDLSNAARTETYPTHTPRQNPQIGKCNCPEIEPFIQNLYQTLFRNRQNQRRNQVRNQEFDDDDDDERGIRVWQAAHEMGYPFELYHL